MSGSLTLVVALGIFVLECLKWFNKMLTMSNAVKEIWSCVKKVKVHQRRCMNLAWRCNRLIDALRDNTSEMAVAENKEAMDKAELILQSVRGRVEKWAKMNTIRSILNQQAISEGVDHLSQEIDTCMTVYQLQITQQLIHDQKVQALTAERDRIELQETVQHVLEAFNKHTREHRPGTPYIPSHGDMTEDSEVLYGIEEEIDSIPSSSSHNAFEHAIERIGFSLETLELSLPSNADHLTASRDSTNRNLPNSQISVETQRPTRSIRQSLLSSWRSSSVSLSCPQIPPLDLVTVWFPSDPFPTESSMSARSSVYSARSSTRSGQHSISTITSHHTSPTSTGSISTISRISSPLEVALTTPENMWLFSGNPRVIKKATMEGFIQYLLLNPADAQQHDTFFIGHPALISPQDVLNILDRRFCIAADNGRGDVQISIMRLINNWLTNQNVIIANDVLTHMQNLAVIVGSSDALDDLAVEVLQRIPNKASLNFPSSPIISSFRSRLNTTPTPRQLAVGLATLERKTYLCIRAAEYVAYSRNLTSYCPNLREAITLNNRIANWVMFSVMKADNCKERSNTKRFFVKTAKECLKIRNFSSMCAIVRALQSDTITCLTLTHGNMLSKERTQYQKLTTLLKQESNFSAYKAAVQHNGGKACIPWHDAHIHDISTILQEEENVDEHHEPPLINVEKWSHLKEKALDALHYRNLPPEYDEDGLEIAAAYLMRELQAVVVNDDFSQLLQRRSAELRQNEVTMPKGPGTLSGAVGFN